MSFSGRRTEVVMVRFFRILVPFIGLSAVVFTTHSSTAQDHAKSAIAQNGTPSPAFLALQERAGQGYTDAELKLAADYSTGQDVEVNQAAAKLLVSQSSREWSSFGSSGSRIPVRHRIGDSPGRGRSGRVVSSCRRWRGHRRSLPTSLSAKSLGWVYLKTRREGFLNLSRAAKRHNSFAETYLGDLYYFGIGTAADPVRAENLYQKAAKEGQSSRVL